LKNADAVTISSNWSLQCGPHHDIFHFCGPRFEKVGHPCSRGTSEKPLLC